MILWMHVLFFLMMVARIMSHYNVHVLFVQVCSLYKIAKLVSLYDI